MTRMQMIDSQSGKSFLLREGPNVIGREADCDIQIESTSISRKHCRVDCAGSSMIVRDLGSTNGTLVNGESVTRVLCDAGDTLRIGDFQFQLETVSEAQFAAISSNAAANTLPDEDDSVDLMAGLDLDGLEEADGVPEATASPDDLLNGIGFESLESAPEEKGAEEPDGQQTDLLAEFGLENLDTVVPNSDTTPGVKRPAPRSAKPRKKSRPKRPPAQQRPAPQISQPEPAAPAPQPIAAAPPAAPSPPPSPVTPPPAASIPQRKPTPAMMHPKPKPKAKRQKAKSDFSFKKFVEERTGLVVTLGILLLLAAFFVVPWGSFFRTSDADLLTFYEGVLQRVEEHRGQANPQWDAFAKELKDENWVYVSELSSAGKLSVTARQLLNAGKNDLPRILQRSRTKKSASEELFANRVKAARAAYDGTEISVAPTGETESELVEDMEDSMFGSGEAE